MVQHRHASLRTRVTAIDGVPAQIIDSPQRFRMRMEDLSTTKSEERENIAKQVGSAFLSEEIDLARGPVLAAKLLKLNDIDHILILGTDHMVSDATSCSLLTGEFLTLYRQGTEAKLRNLKLQFPDFAVWQHNTNDAWFQEHASYWRNRLSGAPIIHIPPDHSRNHSNSNTSKWHYVPFGKKLTDALHDIARRERAMAPLVVLSLYLILVSKWREENDLLVESISHGRHGHPELTHMIGWLAYPMYLRIEIIGGCSMRDVLHQVTAEFCSAMTHDASRVPGNIVKGFPTQLNFNWFPRDSAARSKPPAHDSSGGLKIHSFPIAKDDPAIFSVFFKESPSGLIAMVKYHTSLFDQRTLQRFGSHLRLLAQQFVLDPGMQLPPLDFGR